MKWSKSSRITAIICGTVLILGIVYAEVFSGKEFDGMGFLNTLLTGLGAILAGMGIAAGPSKKSGPNDLGF